MRKITYTNPDGVSVVLGDETYGITSLTGIESPSLLNQEQKAPYQDGTTPIDQLLNPREIVVTGVICSGVLVTIAARRRALISALNPKLGPGTITLQTDAGTFEITGRPDELRFANKNANDHAQSFQVVFYCHDPYFRDSSDTVVSLDSTNSSDTPITIIGDVSSPFSVVITGTGSGPKIIETLRSVYLEYENFMDQKLLLDTRYGHKTAIEQFYSMFKLSCVWGNGSVLAYSEKIGGWLRFAATSLLASSGDGVDWNYVVPKNQYPVIAYTTIEWFKSINAYLAFGTAYGDSTPSVCRSKDGIDWSAGVNIGGALPANTTPIRIKYIEAKRLFVGLFVKYVAGTRYLYILTSSDAVNWTRLDTGVAMTPYDIDYLSSAGLYAVVGTDSADGPTTHVINTSPDLVTFTPRTNSATGKISGVMVDPNNNRLLSCGNEIMASTDAINWTIVVSDTDIRKLTYNAKTGLYIGFGYTKIKTSPTCAVWTTRFTSAYSGDTVNDIRWSPPDNYFLAITTSGSVLKSVDALSWSKLIDHTTYVGPSGGGLTNGEVFYSRLLKKWIAIGANVSVASTDELARNFVMGTIVSPTFSINTKSVPIDATNISKVVFVASGVCYGSTDGLAWSSLASMPDSTFNCIAYNSDLGIYCAFGNNGAVATSPDCVTWTLQKNVGAYYMSRVIYVPERKRFYAVGACISPGAGKVTALLTSSDGAEWTNIAPSVILDASIRTIAYSKTQDRIVITAQNMAGCVYTGAGIYTSTDDVQWTEKKVFSIGNDVGIIYSDILKKWIFGDIRVLNTDQVATYLSSDGYAFESPTDYVLVNDKFFGGQEVAELGLLVSASQDVILTSTFGEGDNAIAGISAGSEFFSLVKGQNSLALRCPRGAFKADLTYRNRYMGL